MDPQSHRYGSTLKDITPPTRQAALDLISRIRPTEYARTRNHIEGAVTGLSPYVTHGLVTLPEILGHLLLHTSLEVGHKLIYEFGWREFFRHVWSHEQDAIFHSLHAGPLPDADYARALPADIRNAATGLSVVDQAVRTLYRTGTLHNHARMWLASYVVHLRRVHWRVGADWLVAHLLDGDLASNHLSWQWVAGTGSHKPYLFNAENVARYAPETWHSPGSVVDRPYAELEAVARGALPAMAPAGAWRSGDCGGRDEGWAEPVLYAEPPEEMGLGTPCAARSLQIEGREVWLVHPWALRPPPPDLPEGTEVIGVYLRDYHQHYPWPEVRWRWVDTAMRAITSERWFIDADTLKNALSGASRVHAVADPHLTHLLAAFTRLEPAPLLFPLADRRCRNFSQWWKRVTKGLTHAEELL